MQTDTATQAFTFVFPDGISITDHGTSAEKVRERFAKAGWEIEHATLAPATQTIGRRVQYKPEFRPEGINPTLIVKGRGPALPKDRIMVHNLISRCDYDVLVAWLEEADA